MRRDELTPHDREVLCSLRLFEDVSDDTKSRLTEHVRVHTLKRGETLFEHGQPANSFFAVVSGWVKLFNRRPDGTEAVLGIFSTGETFAEAALFLSGDYPATAEAVTDARLIEFEREFFVAEKLQSPGLCGGMLASLSFHLQRLSHEIERLQNRNGEQRLAHFILSLCPKPEGPANIRLPYEKTLIAARLGLKPETLSRIFPKLRDVGVTVRRNNVSVADIGRLRRHCG